MYPFANENERDDRGPVSPGTVGHFGVTARQLLKVGRPRWRLELILQFLFPFAHCFGRGGHPSLSGGNSGVSFNSRGIVAALLLTNECGWSRRT
jgi:hypothetical protein